jgi:hypothetical protein
MDMSSKTTTATKIPLAQIIDAINQAEAAAIAADPNEDGGTCCLDTPLIKLDRYTEDDIQAVTDATGIRIGDKMSGFWRGYRFLWTKTHGQAERRSQMAEAAYRKLNELGIPCHFWQQCD